ncbi:MAG: SRPBCC family protein [Nonlabens sp.]
MPRIEIFTEVNAPVELVFDLARDVNLHEKSMAHTNEKAVAGRTSGKVEEGDQITWEATHLGVRQRLISHITVVKPPHFFADEMVSGAFKSFTHEHFFEFGDGVTTMRDLFVYESPWGILGAIADQLFLAAYMRRLLEKRNSLLKITAEELNSRRSL